MTKKYVHPGDRYGRLVVIEEIGSDKWGTRLWKCRCDCGEYSIVTTRNLTAGNTKSCGCLSLETHLTHGMRNTRFYKVWQAMKNRCRNKKLACYPNYGGRGIKYCKEWMSLECFRDDMYESYLDHAEEYGEKNTTLDRIDVNGDYCKENCRWVTKGEQSFNRRNSTFVIYEGKTYNLTHLARKLNVDRETIKRNLIDGVYMGKKKHDQ